MIFEANTVFLHCVHFEQGDLSYILKENDKVTVETTEFIGSKERKRIYTRVKAALEKLGSYGIPNHCKHAAY